MKHAFPLVLIIVMLVIAGCAGPLPEEAQFSFPSGTEVVFITMDGRELALGDGVQLEQVLDLLQGASPAPDSVTDKDTGGGVFGKLTFTDPDGETTDIYLYSGFYRYHEKAYTFPTEAERALQELFSPVPLQVSISPETQVSLDKDYILKEGLSASLLVDILEKAVLMAKDFSIEGSPLRGRLNFGSGSENQVIQLYEGYVSYRERVYALPQPKLKAIIEMFVPAPPVEIEGLVRIQDLDPSIIIDLKYATSDNFTGQVIYPVAVGVIDKETGERLAEANRIFRQNGFCIKVWDAYRPLHVQQILWEAFPDPRYVLKPPSPPYTSLKARHNNGMSVDITLVDSSGREVEMPTGFDDFTEEAAPDYPNMSNEARRNVEYLVAVMESVGFKGVSTEWWHFNNVSDPPQPYLDLPLQIFLNEWPD